MSEIFLFMSTRFVRNIARTRARSKRNIDAVSAQRYNVKNSGTLDPDSASRWAD